MRVDSYVRSVFGAAAAAAVLAVASGCGSSSDTGDYQPVPTRTTTVTPSQSPVVDPGNVVGVRDFVLQPTYSCVDSTPRRAVVTVAWTAPSATGVQLSLDGKRLATGLQSRLPYQVPAGGPTGIGATVAFACEEPSTHTITIDWTGTGLAPASRTVTITQEPTNDR